jgi:hypothetical protein
MKIFWSWQSDHDGKISRHLVREALELAAANMNEDLAVEEPEREVSVDHDRKGVPGSPDLAAVILEKIRTSDVFVADVTPVGATANEPPKKLMNPNVAIELGYALHNITDRRLIMVMNSAFGSHTDLPFDLKHKAGTIFYELKPGAGKDEIQTVRKKLSDDLKVALRKMLSLVTPVAPEFIETVPRNDDPARYYEPAEVLADRGTSPTGKPDTYTAPETPVLYLRVVPTKPTQALKRQKAIGMVREGPNHINPFHHNCRTACFEPNTYGAIAFDANHDNGQIVAAAQLFLNREIWAFNSVLVRPEIVSTSSGRQGIPTLSVEKNFAIMLREYLQVMHDKLGVPPPYRIEAGATGVKGRMIFMPSNPSNFSESEWGPILDNNVTWTGTLTSIDAAAVDAALLEIFEAFFDAGACKRPDKLYGFPGGAPGASPRNY